MRLAALRTSSKHVRESCGIDHTTAFVDLIKEIGIPDCSRHHEIDFSIKELFQIEKEIEIRVKNRRMVGATEFDEKIEIASLGTPSPIAGGAESLERLDTA